MAASPLSHRETRYRVDLDSRSKLVIEDLLERGLFNDPQEILAAAIAALQLKLAAESAASEYDDDEAQEAMDRLQLGRDEL